MENVTAENATPANTGAENGASNGVGAPVRDETHERDWLHESEFMRIQFQHGLAPVVGVNGVRVEDVMDAALWRLQGYQSGPLACRENAEAIDAIHRAKDAMARRRQRREMQGVFNTYEPHKSERTEDALEDFSATGA